MLQKVRGTKDLKGDDVKKRNFIIDCAARVAVANNFNELHLPIIEHSEIYERNLGEESDVVSKEIYRFLDRSGDCIALRPEFTAGVARHFIEESLFQSLPQKFFSYGTLYRYDRPQKGRQREFCQANFEVYGANGFMYDVQNALMAYGLCKMILVDGDADDKKLTLKLNYIGSAETKTTYSSALYDYFAPLKNSLSEDSKRRLTVNPLRILDSKAHEDIELLLKAPQISAFYTQEEMVEFGKILETLEVLGVNYQVDQSIIRGLDYYNGLVFEVVSDAHDGSSSQGALGGGGRYDGLTFGMCGKSCAAVGFAVGVERLMALIGAPTTNEAIIAVTNIDEHLQLDAFKIANKLRTFAVNDTKRRVRIEFIDLQSGNFGKKMKKMNQIGANFAILVGSDEFLAKSVRIKNFATGSESLVEINALNRLLGGL